MHTDDARRVLAVWRENLLTDAQVADWAAEALEATPAKDLPEWLLDLCMYGVTACMNRPSSEFLDVPLLSFAERLAIRVRKLDLSRSDQMEEFVDWISRACMGEDLARPEVSFGYYVDHLWSDRGKMDEAQAADECRRAPFGSPRRRQSPRICDYVGCQKERMRNHS